MLFITNRSIQQGLKLKVGRRIDFDLKNNKACQSIYFCLREDKHRYMEVGNFKNKTKHKQQPNKQKKNNNHKNTNMPEENKNPRRLALQKLFDDAQPNLVY